MTLRHLVDVSVVQESDVLHNSPKMRKWWECHHEGKENWCHKQKKINLRSFHIYKHSYHTRDVYLFFPNPNQKTRTQPSIICWNPDAVFCRKWPSDVCFYRFWRFRCFAISVSVTFVVTPTSWVWTLSDVCCRLMAKRFSPHDLRWRQIVKIFNCLFCYTESLYWTLCTHYEHCSSYMNRNLKIFEYESIFLFFDHLLCLFFFFKHNKLLTRKLEFLLFSTSWTPVQLHISSSASKTWTSEQSTSYWADDCIMLWKQRGLVSGVYPWRGVNVAKNKVV